MQVDFTLTQIRDLPAQYLWSLRQSKINYVYYFVDISIFKCYCRKMTGELLLGAWWLTTGCAYWTVLEYNCLWIWRESIDFFNGLVKFSCCSYAEKSNYLKTCVVNLAVFLNLMFSRPHPSTIWDFFNDVQNQLKLPFLKTFMSNITNEALSTMRR